MKKFPFVLLCAATVALIGCNKKDNKSADVEPEPEPAKEYVAATMENEAGGINCPENGIWQGADEPIIGSNAYVSGDYTFVTYKNEYQDEHEGEPYTVTYYDGITVSSETASTSTGAGEAYRSAKGGAHSGKNFAVWYPHWGATEDIVFEEQVVPGFFINNNAYTVEAITMGTLTPARAFGPTDVLTLIIIGKLGEEEVGRKEVKLAADGKYIVDWTYVSLAQLGKIDRILFDMTSTDILSYDDEYGHHEYANTPTYFCFDDFGVEMPEGYVEPAKAEIPGNEPIEGGEGEEGGEGGEEA